MTKDFQSEPTFEGWRVPSEQSLPMFRTELRRWRAAYYGRKTMPSQSIICIGDSITEGYYASTRTRRYVDILAQILNSDVSYQAASAPGYVPAVRGSTMPPGWKTEWVKSGGVSDLTNFGLGRRSWNMTAAGHYMEIEETFDYATIHYAIGTGVARFSVTVDGVLVGVVNSYAAALAGGQVTIGPFPLGNHKIRLDPLTKSTGGTDYNVVIEGAYFYAGNYGKGIRVYEAGRAGDAFSGLGVGATGNITRLAWTPIAPALVTVLLGANDNGQTEANTEARANYLLDSIRDFAGDPDVLMVSLFAPSASSRTDADWQPIRRTIKRVAKARGKAFLDLYNIAGFLGADTLDWTDDLLHPNDRGFQMIAEAMAEVLTSGMAPTNTAPTTYDEAMNWMGV